MGLQRTGRKAQKRLSCVCVSASVCHSVAINWRHRCVTITESRATWKVKDQGTEHDVENDVGVPTHLHRRVGQKLLRVDAPDLGVRAQDKDPEDLGQHNGGEGFN